MDDNNAADHPLVAREDSNVVVVMPAATTAAGGAVVSYQSSSNAQSRASPVVVENLKNGNMYKWVKPNSSILITNHKKYLIITLIVQKWIV